MVHFLHLPQPSLWTYRPPHCFPSVAYRKYKEKKKEKKKVSQRNSGGSCILPTLERTWYTVLVQTGHLELYSVKKKNIVSDNRQGTKQGKGEGGIRTGVAPRAYHKM